MQDTDSSDSSGRPGAGVRRPSGESGSSGVRSVSRAIAILNAFTRENPRLGLHELARIAELTPSTTHRVLSSLAQHQLVLQSAPGEDYSLGPAVLRMALVADEGMDVIWLSKDTLTALRDESGETAALHVLEAPWHRVTLAQQEGVYPLRRIYTDIGEPIPLNQGAPSLALLAHLPAATIDEVLSRRLDAATPRTLVDPDAIREELDQVRRRGYALSTDARIVGVFGVAAPVFDYRSNVMAAISVSGSSASLSESRHRILGEMTRRHAEELSARMGFVIPGSPTRRETT